MSRKIVYKSAFFAPLNSGRMRRPPAGAGGAIRGAPAAPEEGRLRRRRRGAFGAKGAAPRSPTAPKENWRRAPAPPP